MAYERETYRAARRFGAADGVDLPVSATTELGQLREAINDYLARTLEGQQPEGVTEIGGPLAGVVERLGDLLAAAPQPLLVHAADQRGSRAEKRAHVENALKHLPRYHAWSKVLRAAGAEEVTAEHVILTAPFHPVDDSPAAQARVAALHKRSMERCGTPIDRIEAALAARLSGGGKDEELDAPAGVPPRGPRLSGATERRSGSRAPLVQEAVVDDDEEW